MSVMHQNVAVCQFDIHLDGPLPVPERLSDLFQGRHLEFGAFYVPIQRLEVHNESALAVLLWYQEQVRKEALVVLALPRYSLPSTVSESDDSSPVVDPSVLEPRISPLDRPVEACD